MRVRIDGNKSKRERERERAAFRITSAAVASGKDQRHLGCIKLLDAIINDGVAGAWLILTIG